ncbi:MULTISPECIES: formylglycine-generating enzyme family protein [Bacillus cereus group]|uniref:Sulfatase-modifying factor enzyme-like domain-containing protein n=1 Tax=Bacillus cytotoxicus (strain DSM 22905 / CIP 110041 / 391-98 / NVH 391-98) TaxID=315749 RepID=A7GK84_BACCN|nr:MULTISPECIES: SUMF1/EgtB/PvdO family nonheme iron enzyme [Bacillus cereus group]ABS20542.1 protein of unknown function DUF323 [Bacillus cytotoxicus NVH 391-98]AWC27173.1 hypothetical protein CG483_001185 [Bacillus cytotoxicus]AWC39287.1 hypothetical protein CG480_001185 [Bacillus cytotoxicus]AWC43288.1 hypothetical protein CG479_001060 [Bacillus cytotoxicus]AWC47218.1 hypothetical protein CG478_001185 [Bacillus cytotoxicus]
MKLQEDKILERFIDELKKPVKNSYQLYNDYVLLCSSNNREIRIKMKELEIQNQKRFLKYLEPDMISIETCSYNQSDYAKPHSYIYDSECCENIDIYNFQMSKTCITKELYQLYDKGYQNDYPSDSPVVDVNWYEAMMFSYWIGCRLPLEVEWEYVANVGLEDIPFENDIMLDYAWYSMNSNNYLESVGKKLPNKFGIYDMQGLVWEWCLDSIELDKNPYLIQRYIPYRVCRGGSFYSFLEVLSPTYRYGEKEVYSSRDLGFRVVKSDVVI